MKNVWVIAAGLALLCLVTLGRVVGNDFINYDDYQYITENPAVRTGLTLEGLRWALFGSWGYVSNADPLTWISHQLDVQIFGLDPWGHHLTNLLLHAANTVILFLFLTWATGRLWPAAFAAALFAVHPMHVESVAWLAERKGLLSTFFLLLALAAWVRHARRPSLSRYLTVLLLFILGLMSKPMVVTFPLLLMILDVWPLGRLAGRPAGAAGSPPARLVWGLVREKIPLFLVAGAYGIATYLALARGMARTRLDQIPLAERLAAAPAAYLWYLAKMAWPGGLSVIYPSMAWPWWKSGAALWALAVVTLWTILETRRRAYLAMGWLWYLAAMVPVIGLVQVGLNSVADRYTYVPFIGLFAMVAWSAAGMARTWELGRKITALAGMVLVSALSLASWRQAGFWRDSVALFERAVLVAPGSYIAQFKLGQGLQHQGISREASEHYALALKLKPPGGDTVEMHRMAMSDQGAAHPFPGSAGLVDGRADDSRLMAMGDTLAAQGRLDEAIDCYRKVLELGPDNLEAGNKLGAALFKRGRADEALACLGQLLATDPDNHLANVNMGVILERQGRLGEAAGHYREALRARPDDRETRNHLEKLLARSAGPAGGYGRAP